MATRMSAAAVVAEPVLHATVPARPANAVETEAVLRRLCGAARDLLGVGRATVLRYADPVTLVPALAVSDEAVRRLAFELTQDAAATLRRETVVVIPDAAASPEIADEWRTAYGLVSLAVVPLHVEGHPWGALIVDDPGRRHEFGDRDVRTLTELAGLAGVAVSAAECAAAASAEASLRGAVREAATRLHVTLDLGEAVASVSPFLLGASGFEITDAALVDPALARTLACPTTTRYAAEALRPLRNGGDQAVTTDGRLLVALRNHSGLSGLLELRSSGSAPKRLDLVHEVADRLAATVDQIASTERDAEHEAMTEHAQVRVALARQAIGRTLRTFRGAGYAKGGPTLFDVASVDNARRALEDLDEVRQVLAAQSSAPALASALEALLDAVPAKTYEVTWATSGIPRPIAPETEIACLRAALRVANLVKETRGSILAVQLTYLPDGAEIVLTSNGLLRDDGADAPVGDLVGPWVREVGGTAEFEVTDGAYSVRVTVPAPTAVR